MKKFLACLAALLPILIANSALAQLPPTPPPFASLGGIATLAATTSTGNVALAADPNAFGALTIYNGGTVDAYIALGGSSITAAATGGCTNTGISLGPSCVIRAGKYITIWTVGYTYLAGITGSSTATLTIYQGTGPVIF